MIKFDIEKLFIKVRGEIINKSLGIKISHPRYVLGKQMVRTTSLIINPINSVNSGAIADVEKVDCVSFKRDEPVEYEKYVMTIYDTRFNEEDMTKIFHHEFAHIMFDEIYEKDSSKHSKEFQDFGELLGQPREVFTSQLPVPKYIIFQSRYVVECRHCNKVWCTDVMDDFIKDIINYNRVCFCGHKDFKLTIRAE